METTIDKEISQNLQPELIKQVVEMLDTAIEATIEIRNLYSDDKYDVANQLLDDIHSMMDSLKSHTEVLTNERKHSLAKELYENVQDTLEDINMAINNGNNERTLEKIEFQLLPFIRNIRESFYFWGLIYPNKEKMDMYYKEEFANNYRNYYVNEDGNYQYKLSIVVPAYNHVDVTKRCVEQLMKVTDFEKLNAELILLDHGSTDSTLEYFEKLGIGKVVHFKKNVRMYMFTTMAQICRGEYFAYISNDVLVTRDWAEILLNCLESDSNIVVSVPTTPNVCNYQMLNVPTDDPDEFVKLADENNRANSSKWNDRARIIPPLCSYNTKLVNEIGFADPLFYSMEFWDDDFSLRARRKGYRQIVCDDVSCYHYGSVTGKEYQKKEGTLEYGRKLFMLKHGVDAWGQGFCYDIQSVSILKQLITLLSGDINLLAIDCGFGDTVFQVQNELRQRDKKYELFCINSQEKYNEDLNKFVKNYSNTYSIENEIKNYPKDLFFNLVWIDRDLEFYEDLDSLFRNIKNRLNINGHLVCHCSNPYNIITINNILNLNMTEERKILIDYNNVIQIAKKYFKKLEIIRIPRRVEGIEQFVDRHYRDNEHKHEIIDRLSIEKYYFILEK